MLLHHLALALATLGAVNWGLIGLFDINLVTSLLGAWPMAVKAAYILIGLSGLALAAHEVTEHHHTM